MLETTNKYEITTKTINISSFFIKIMVTLCTLQAIEFDCDGC